MFKEQVTFIFEGGNQRELARAKAQKKQQEQQKRKGSKDQAGNSGQHLQTRKERYPILIFKFCYLKYNVNAW